ncbi:hypothetical protein ANN_06691 [Periplaneta americana]|uniref:Uncharacterized protein n=1 Tax=Periplaneta americana TaxID=6978 RepID=A0ABQ8TF35_PERAM|nr:hypothetical protein ANN_06691 [Periplaneta americana]
MAGLYEGGNEPAGSLKPFCRRFYDAVIFTKYAVLLRKNYKQFSLQRMAKHRQAELSEVRIRLGFGAQCCPQWEELTFRHLVGLHGY